MSEPYYADDTVTLYGGDALAVLRELPSGSVDAVITDPPYSSGGMFRGDRVSSTGTKYTDSDSIRELANFTGDNRDQRGYAYWTALWTSEARRVTREGGAVIMFTDWRQLPTTSDALQSGGWIWWGVIPWLKPQARPQLGRFTNQAEYAVWGLNGPKPIEGSVLPGWYQVAAPRDRDHQTQKPVLLMRELVKIVPDGGTVIDPFMGSGTTGVAAMLERRRFIGVEMVEHYQRVAERRIREAQGQAVEKGDQAALDFGAPA